jgi:hypothetical protein
MLFSSNQPVLHENPDSDVGEDYIECNEGLNINADAVRNALLHSGVTYENLRVEVYGSLAGRYSMGSTVIVYGHVGRTHCRSSCSQTRQLGAYGVRVVANNMWLANLQQQSQTYLTRCVRSQRHGAFSSAVQKDAQSSSMPLIISVLSSMLDDALGTDLPMMVSLSMLLSAAAVPLNDRTPTGSAPEEGAHETSRRPQLHVTFCMEGPHCAASRRVLISAANTLALNPVVSQSSLPLVIERVDHQALTSSWQEDSCAAFAGSVLLANQGKHSSTSISLAIVHMRQTAGL